MYIDDLVEGLVRMMNTPDSVTGPINIGNPNEFSILELAYRIIALTNSKSKLIFKALPQDDPAQRKPDISLALNTLNGWKPRVELEAGLKPTIDYFSKILNS